jgi:formylglycine-generating enzyme required for sulfatase activity/tetratricopeptide (TPR) repeat protein
MLLLGPVSAPDLAQQPLAWRWRAHDQFFVEWGYQRQQKNRANGEERTTSEDTTLVARIAVLQVNADHSTVLEMKIVHVRHAMIGAPPNPLTQMLEGATARLTLDAGLSVTHVDGLESLATVIGGKKYGPQHESLRRSLDGSFRSMAATAFCAVPRGPLRPGLTWRQTGEMGFLGFASELETRVFTAGKAKSDGDHTVQSIGFTAVHSFGSVPPGMKTPPLPEITRDDEHGSVCFDFTAGRVLHGQTKASVEGRLRITGNGQSIDTWATGIKTAYWRILDRDPMAPTSACTHAKVPDQDGSQGTGRVGATPAKELTNSLGMRLVLIPPGRFTMGSPVTEEGRAFDEDERDVEISRPFYMAAHEVTIGQFRKFVKEAGYQTDSEKGMGCFGFDAATKRMDLSKAYSWKKPGWQVTDEHSVTNLSWNDAKAFCAWLSKKEGKSYRLPTEAEWEYACRAGTTTRYTFGDDPEELAHHGNITDASAKKLFPFWTTIKADDGHAFTAPVGSYRPNAFGLYDMHGNAAEWCEDWYAFYEPGPHRDPTGPSAGTRRVARGGNWADFPLQCQSAHRNRLEPSGYNVGTGLRVVVSLDPGVVIAPFCPVIPEPPYKRLLTGKTAGQTVALEDHAKALAKNAKLSEALVPARKLLALRTRHQGPDHWQTQDARRQVHYCEILAKLSPRDLAEMTQAIGQVSQLPAMARQGKVAEARALLEKSLGVMRRLIHEDFLSAPVGYNQLAQVLHEQHDLDQALVLEEKCLEICKRMLGEQHPETIRAYNDVGNWRFEQERYAEAEAPLRRAAELARVVNGEGHVETAKAYDNLANVLNHLQKSENAQSLHDKALEIFLATLGEGHVDTVKCSYNLAINLCALGRFDEAEWFLRKTLEYDRKHLGPDAPQTVLNDDNLAFALMRQGDLAGAEALLREALAARRRSLGEKHPLTVESYQHLIANLRMQDKLEAVRELETEAGNYAYDLPPGAKQPEKR